MYLNPQYTAISCTLLTNAEGKVTEPRPFFMLPSHQTYENRLHL